jgi:hypothetical protein
MTLWRPRVNSLLATLRSNFSGTSAPTNPAPVAGQLFAKLDGSDDVTNLQIFNGGTETWTDINLGAAYDASNVTITGGTINGVVIGGSTAAAGTFTDLVATGEVTFDGGGIDNVTIGAIGAGPGTFTVLNGASLTVSNSTSMIPVLMEEARFTDIAFNAGWNRKATKDGFVSTFPHRLSVDTGDVADGVAGAATSGSSGWFRGKNRNTINFSKRIKFRFSLAQYDNTTNGKSWVTFGRDGFTGEAIGDPADKAIGVRIDNNAIKGIVHDGSTLTVVDLSTTLTADELYDVIVDSNGGNVSWYLNGSGTAAGTTANGPTGDKSGAAFRVECDNGGDSAAQAIVLSTLTVYAEQ